MNSSDTNRALVEGDLEWLRDDLLPRKFQWANGRPDRVAHNARIDRLLALLSSHQEGAGNHAEEREAVARLENALTEPRRLWNDQTEVPGLDGVTFGHLRLLLSRRSAMGGEGGE